jgi:hypothetical protein
MSCFAAAWDFLSHFSQRFGSRRDRRAAGILFTGTGSSFAQPQIRCVLGEGGEEGCVSCNLAAWGRRLGERPDFSLQLKQWKQKSW